MKDFLLNPITLVAGCILLSILLVLSLYHLYCLKAEFSRYKAKLSDKFEIEADTLSKLKAELSAVRKENENLRIKVQGLSSQPEQKLGRELEVFARAEKKMTVAAPGFASPWEQAKQSAHQEIADEEAGKAAPRTLFQRFFGGAAPAESGEQVKSLTSPAEASKGNSASAR